MKLLAIRFDRDTQLEVEYEFNEYSENIQCLYKDKNGCYICTKQGKIHKIKMDFLSLQELVGL
jgi:Tfp pilus assembly protein PilP